MSAHQSKIDRLIAELCPNGVEFRKLGEVCEIEKGKQLNKELLSEKGEYPAYNGGISYSGFTDNYNYTENTIIISQGGASAGFVNFVATKFYANAHCYVVLPKKEIVENRYIYHFLKLNQEKLAEKQHGAGIPALRTGEISSLLIPVPPLKIQEEIVGILDKFTQLEAELEAELEARKKQYKYYRDDLLSFGDDVEWKTLKEVSIEFSRGKSKHRPRNDKRLYGGSTPFIQTGDIRNASHIITKYTQTYSEFGLTQSKLWPKGTLCITIAANIAETTILGFDSCFPDSVIGFVANPEKTTSTYVEYLLSSYKSRLQSKSTGSAQDNINLATFESLHLPFPSLDQQSRIVSILDRFDALVNDISIGLPAEIKARRQQYEYYRGKLLTFNEYAKQ